MHSDETGIADREFKRILLIKLSAFGDVIHTIALMNALRRRYPGAQIDWLLKPSVAEFIRHHPGVSNVLVYGENQTEVPQYNWDGFTHFVRLMNDSKFVQLLKTLRATKYDLVVDVHGQMRTGFVTRLTGAPVRIGFDRPRREIWEQAEKELPPGTVQRAWKGAREGSWMAYTHHIRLDTLDRHAVDRYLRVGTLLGFEAEADFQFPIPPDARARIDAILLGRGVPNNAKPIVLSPAALWETKRWQPDGYSAVARHFLAAAYPVVVIGSDTERDECRRIEEGAPGVINIAGETSLIELAALISRSAICLTNDSGPMHLAAALGIPVLGVFGPTHSRWVGPYGQSTATLNAGQACSPCYLRDLKRCGYDHSCMSAIAPGHVIERMEEVLRAAGSQKR